MYFSRSRIADEKDLSLEPGLDLVTVLFLYEMGSGQYQFAGPHHVFWLRRAAPSRRRSRLPESPEPQTHTTRAFPVTRSHGHVTHRDGAAARPEPPPTHPAQPSAHPPTPTAVHGSTQPPLRWRGRHHACSRAGSASSGPAHPHCRCRKRTKPAGGGARTPAPTRPAVWAGLGTGGGQEEHERTFPQLRLIQIEIFFNLIIITLLSYLTIFI